ncbi:MAG: Nif3-like dinuclear metal center hexameric protein [Dehalococcoidales bacterium]|nr:Nif3-like dinuclear metal center hexameric protein [Dehalococcoidales bacterium]
MNVKDVVDIILELNGGRKFEETCDQLIEGSWEQEVTGVVTTFMATIDVIRRTIDLGYNLIITHEPTYFTGRDHIDWVKNDPAYQLKKALIDDNGISIWRYHDHMHSGITDLIYAGLLKELGWEDYLDAGQPQPHCYSIPEMTLGELVEFFTDKLEMENIRIVGNPDTLCRRVGILVGGGSLGLGVEEMPAKLMHDENLDVIVCGEITEWTLSAYARDAGDLGLNKAIIIVGHERSEEPGMKYLAELIQPLLGELPVEFVDSGEPFYYL